MVDVTAIVIAVVSFATAIGSTLFTVWINYLAEERKRRLTESEKLVRKYRDPLLLAAQDLQSRLWSICEGKGLVLDPQDPFEEVNLFDYTPFLVGQFLSWTYIYRQQAQFLGGPTDKANRSLTKIIFAIKSEFNKIDPDRRPFRLWHGQQLAIGEIMTVYKQEVEEFYCISYTAFKKEWDTGQNLKDLFKPISIALKEFHDAKKIDKDRLDQRLCRLQNLLVDLIELLDPEGVRTDSEKLKRCKTGDSNSKIRSSPTSMKRRIKLPWCRKGSQTSEQV